MVDDDDYVMICNHWHTSHSYYAVCLHVKIIVFLVPPVITNLYIRGEFIMAKFSPLNDLFCSDDDDLPDRKSAIFISALFRNKKYTNQ